MTQVATPGAGEKNPGMVLDFYNMRRRDVKAALPNAAHLGLAGLESAFDVQIITQNIDDLHERAGSSNVLHLHGEIFKMRSEVNDDLVYEIRDDIQLGEKSADGKQLRPHIVWFEEAVPLIGPAARMVNAADIFVVVGTSLLVYPAAGLIHYAGAQVPKFIVDKKIPPMPEIPNLVKIEKPATSGIVALISILKEQS